MEFSAATWIIIAGAIATYLTRIGGHVVLSRFDHIHPRVDAGLRAVPTAVLAAIVAPYAAYYGVAETITLVAVALMALRLPSLAIFCLGWLCILGLRQMIG
ncbi:MAG: AzlD domain-containing protein [Ahrensia sp.]|nr:AzlD domain-containing protein [Ahrensia sp.]